MEYGGITFSIDGRDGLTLGGQCREGTELSRTPTNGVGFEDNVVHIKGADSSNTSSHSKDEASTSFPGGSTTLDLLPSFRHHVLLDIWRNTDSLNASTMVLKFQFCGISSHTRRRTMPKTNVTAENAIAMADAMIAFLSGVEGEEEDMVTGTTTHSDGAITSTTAVMAPHTSVEHVS
ncbi:hypothetical protein Syun_007258 [Stephania yunnanensis]|uniref:Uncharacterized protein n=1 Tax=Stephania yunnanensis TaxID=152371 RepID=A0AAP0KY45_9MAGN